MFAVGENVRLANGGAAVVRRKLGEGGQGVVYEVSYAGGSYALKWYHPHIFADPAAFYENLKRNVAAGSPSPKFVWPLFLTEKKNDSFGYLMELRPSDYNEFSEFLVARKVFFSSFSAQVEAAVNVVNAFRALHRQGYSYQDLNDGNFFINGSNGDVLICDNDNVAPNGANLGIKGKARYMAPEIVRNIAKPDKYSDYFSLSVVLFELFFFGHPLEGARTNVPCMTEERELIFYGREPLFVFDPNVDMNRPVRGVHNNVLKFWNVYPQMLRDMFVKAFSAEAMNADRLDVARRSRFLDNDWLKCLVNLRALIGRCPCGEELFFNLASDSRCSGCGTVIPRTHTMSFMSGRYRMAMFPGIKIYRCMIDNNSEDCSEICGEISRHPSKPGVWGVKNLDGRIWRIIMNDGSESALEPGRSIPFAKVGKIVFGTNSEALVEGE